jgi:tetratricopeptide (TPR) repeat protein
MQDGLAKRFAALLQRKKKTTGWSVTLMAQKVWDSDNRRGHMSGYLKAIRGNPERTTIFNITRKLGIPDAETELLFESDWPVIRAPGIRVDRTVVGREAAARAVHAALNADSAAAIVPGVVVSGSGGMGKSTLVRYYAREYERHYYGIWWLGAQSRESLIADFVKLAGHLEIDANAHPTDEALAFAVVMALSNQIEPWLLIYDNAEKYSDLRDWLPEGIYALVTSRTRLWPNYGVVVTQPLETDTAADLIMSEARREEDREGAEKLAHALGGLPLALVLAGTWLRDTPGTSFYEYEDQLVTLIKVHPDEVGLDDYPDSVFGAVKLSIDRLSDNAALLLRLLTYLSPDDLWPGLVTDLVGKLDEETLEWKKILLPIPQALLALAQDRAAVERSFAELVRYSLMERGTEADHPLETGHRVHRLTASVQRALDGGSSRAAATALLAAGYPEIATLEENWPACARRTQAIPALTDGQFGTAALEYLLNQASIWLAMQRRDQLALKYAEQMLCFRETRLGRKHEMTGTACNNLAWRYRRAGRLEEAVSLAQRAFDIGEATSMSGGTRGIRLNTLGLMQMNFADSLTEPARSDMRASAARHYQEAIALGICLNGRASRQVGVRLKNLATLREAEGRWTVALLLHGRALALKRLVSSPDSLEIAYSLNHLGRVLLKSGRGRRGYRGAGCIDLLVEALMVREAVFPDDPGHPERVSTANWLAIANRVLVEPGSPITGTHRADLTESEALEKQYGLDATIVRTYADDIAERTQLFEGKSIEPPPGSFSISNIENG